MPFAIATTSGFTPAWHYLAIARGWGYGSIVPTSIQPDNNLLTTGIIGLTKAMKASERSLFAVTNGMF